MLTCLAGIAVLPSGALGLGLGGCSGGNSFTWTGHGDGHNWNDPENWNPEEEAPPKEGDSVTIQGSEEDEAEVEGATGEVCNLTVEGADAFLTSSHLEIEEDLTWEGGQGMQAASELEGTFTVDGTATLAHILAFSNGSLTSNGPLEVEGGANLTLSDGSAKIVSNGSAELGGGVGGLLGAGAVIQSNSASEGNDNAKLEVNGPLELGGDVESDQLDLNLGAHGSVDLDGNTWTLPGLSFSRWKGGSKVDSSGDGGVMAFTDLAQLLIDGDVTVGEHALISMRGDSLLTDGGLGSSVGLLRGAGVLEWQGGSFERQLTLAPGFHSVLDAGGIHTLIDEPGTLLRNEGTMDVQTGELLVDGAPARIENWGTMKVHAGATLACNSSQCGPGAIDNAPGGELEIVGPAPLQPPATMVHAPVISLHNSGDVKIGNGLMLLLTNDAVANLADGGTISGGGTFRLGQEGKANVVGETTLRDGSVLSIDGTEAELHGGTVNAEGTPFSGVLNAAHSGDGTLQWTDGGLEGSLLTDNQLQTIAAAGGPDAVHNVDGESQDTHDPTRNPTSITLAGPSHIDGVTVTIGSDQNGDAVSVDGPMQIVGAGSGFTRGNSDADGVIVDPGGSITAQGPVAFEAPLSVLGKLIVPSGATLDDPLGYTQTGPNAETAIAGGTVSSDDGEGNLGTIALDGGSLHGPGTVKGNLLDPGATVSPSADGSTPGTLNVDGEYTQHLGGTLALHLAGTAAAQHDKLAVSGAADISGAATAITNAGYAPAVPTTVPDVLDAGSLTGTFATVNSSGAPAGTAWQASYRPGAVDLGLISTGAGGNSGKPGFGKSSKVKLKGGLHVSPKELVTLLVGNSNSFPIEILSVNLKAAPASGKPAHKLARRSRRAIIVASASPRTHVTAGGSSKLSVRLNRKGRQMLSAAHRLAVEVNLRVSAPDGSRATVSGRATLKAPAGGG
ncbi:MAG TPA: hypothetical protein VGF09_09485 [Solirubrobacterales bacterium]